MITVSEKKTTKPDSFETGLQKRVYEVLDELNIYFERVDNDPAITMEDCILIDSTLDVKTVKTLCVCNRQQTMFYLFVTTADKPFSTKQFGSELGISRVSFAPEAKLHELLDTEIGATTFFSLLLETAKNVMLVIDNDVLKEEYYGCTDGTTTSYMKLKTADVLEKLIPYTGHTYMTIDM
ncbi:MAG: YbaK/EbsC family protein [Eubacteriales bacterium]|nr:YbaK/EbsC family protein [Eubacteriales bacterium]